MTNYTLKNASKYRWIFLDLDDTLWDFNANSMQSLSYLYNKYNQLSIAYPKESDFIDSYHDENDRLWFMYHHGEINQEFLKKERFRAILRCTLPNADIESLSKTLNDDYLYKLSTFSQTVYGAKDCLEYLSKKYLIGILSNGFINVQYNKLFNSGIYKYVQRMIVSDEIGIQKPDKRLFDYALQATGTEVESVVMIGDNPDADIQGAINAGWDAIFFDRKERPNVNGALRITDLHELINIL
jgi:putative hydrolase of the HAD superfamily